MMRRIIITISILVLSYSLFANFNFFPDNPANIANRNYSQITFPGLTYEFNVNNSLLRFDDINLFQEGRRLKESEKTMLTSDNIDLYGNFNTTLVDFGKENWNFSIKTIVTFDVELLDKMYTKLVFYGNESDVVYVSHNSEGSKAFAFCKASLDYAYPEALNLGMIPRLFPFETENKFVSGLRDLPVYVGGKINLNYSLVYAGVVESRQEFGTLPDSTFYDIYTRFLYTDEDYSGKLNPSFGFGLKVPFYSGFFHLSMDNIFLQLRYEDLAGGEYSKVVTDSLLWLQEGHEAFEYENIENDSIHAESKTLKINPSFCIGAEYQFFNKLDVMMRYTNNQFAYIDRFYTAAGIQYGKIPLQIGLGYDENVYFQFKTGLNFNKFEWMIGSTFYHGFFRYAKGIGFQSAIKIKY